MRSPVRTECGSIFVMCCVQCCISARHEYMGGKCGSCSVSSAYDVPR